MKTLILFSISFIFIMAIGTTEAQSPAACDVDELQEWYDGLDKDDIMQSAIFIAVDTTQKLTDRAKGSAALEAFYGIIEEQE